MIQSFSKQPFKHLKFSCSFTHLSQGYNSSYGNICSYCFHANSRVGDMGKYFPIAPTLSRRNGKVLSYIGPTHEDLEICSDHLSPSYKKRICNILKEIQRSSWDLNPGFLAPKPIIQPLDPLKLP